MNGAYPTYRASGIDWIGEIPAHWGTTRLKYICAADLEKLGENTPGDYELLYVDIGNVDSSLGITAKQAMFFEDAPSRARKIVRNGDSIVSTVRTYLRAIAKISDPEPNLIVSTGFAVIRPKSVDSSFLSYFLRSSFFVKRVVSISNGVSYPATNSTDIMCIEAVVPPSDEQIAVGVYLDEQIAKLDRLIERKNIFIARLKEKRTALVSQVVTKGLPAETAKKHGLPVSPKMKPSGMDWLGDIPEHWDVKRLRYVGICQNGISKGGECFGSGYPFVSYGDAYRQASLPTFVEGLVESTDLDRKDYSVQKGDVFFTRTSETIEEIGFSSTCLQTIDDAVFAGFLIRFRPFPGRLIEGFSKYYFRAAIHRMFFVKEMNLVTRASLSQELLKKLPVLLPSLDEQKAIAGYLDRETSRIDQLIRKIENAVTLLGEYRESLITSAVAGKIDVRKSPNE